MAEVRITVEHSPSGERRQLPSGMTKGNALALASDCAERMIRDFGGGVCIYKLETYCTLNEIEAWDQINGTY